MRQKLKAPFPYFGGKSAVAPIVWDRLGNVDNYIEPFFGSGAVLLNRPHPPNIETINDLDSYVANFWRATGRDPEAVVEHADWPVNEADLHARHRWLVLSEDAKAFRERMRRDPDYFDAKIAGWWVWGICCWIGSGWCSVDDDGAFAHRNARNEAPMNLGPDGKGNGLIRGKRGPAGGTGDRSPLLAGGEGQYGHGIHAQGPREKRLKLAGKSRRDRGAGVHKENADQLHQKRPRVPRENGSQTGGSMLGVHGQLPMLSGEAGASGRGVHASGANGHRPQLGDAYARGRGVHANDDAGTCAQRRAWLLDWFCRLRDRLRTVRVCCGRWDRVCSSESVTTRLGTTGVFLDPPYSANAGRDMGLYAQDSGDVAHQVRDWCLERGKHPQVRIALCGYVGEGHEELERQGWDVVAWRAQGGYGNRGGDNDNAGKERIWFSPHCQQEATLF